jgi:hypothetical protein
MSLQYCCTCVLLSIKVAVMTSMFCLCRIMKSGKISVNYVISYMVS